MCFGEVDRIERQQRLPRADYLWPVLELGVVFGQAAVQAEIVGINVYRRLERGDGAGRIAEPMTNQPQFGLRGIVVAIDRYHPSELGFGLLEAFLVAVNKTEQPVAAVTAGVFRKQFLRTQQVGLGQRRFVLLIVQ